MYNFLMWLDGKKAVLTAIAGSLNTYALAAGLIDSNMAVLIASIIGALSGTAVVATNQVLGSKYRSKA